MNITIHRGCHEIGGTCIEVSTATTKILLDAGFPLASRNKTIDLNAIKPDAVIVSHPHQDHFGLIEELEPTIPVYICGLGKNLIESTRIFLGKDLHVNTFRHFKPWEEFQVGDFKITPYLVDHSASGAYAFLVEAEGKRIFYSGDFRAHGRKSQLFRKMIAHPPQDIDLLFLEGTMLNRSNDDFPTEESVEEKILETIRNQKNMSFLITSSQNIDRIVSGFRACKRSGKTLVIDIYTAWILEQMKQVSDNVPAMEWDQIGLYASYRQDLTLQINPKFFGDFRKRIYRQRITKDDLRNNRSNYLYISKMSHHRTIELYKGEIPVNVIYSQWLGYLSCTNDEYFGAEECSAYRKDPQIHFVYAHTSGHATVNDLQELAHAMRPKQLVPIHTDHGGRFSSFFENVLEIKDQQPMTI